MGVAPTQDCVCGGGGKGGGRTALGEDAGSIYIEVLRAQEGGGACVVVRGVQYMGRCRCKAVVTLHCVVRGGVGARG